MMRIIRKLFGTPVCELCKGGVVIIKNAACGEPNCYNIALVAYLFQDGIIYSCSDHFMEIADRLREVGEMN